MTLASSKKISCAFNIFIESLPSALSLPGTLEEAKIITLPKPNKDPKFTSDQPLVHYGQTI
jgi:hypothetical protein